MQRKLREESGGLQGVQIVIPNKKHCTYTLILIPRIKMFKKCSLNYPMKVYPLGRTTA